ncbi:MAG: protein translocase subunit SecD [Elusimicrobia bacterium]|nr:protein translocase subunit SecD [Elusimicrobiota bacterium]
MSKLQVKWAFILSLLAVSVFLIYPTINWYQLDAQERAQLEASRLRPGHLLNLGLDLKGGTHMVMELDVARLPADADIPDALSRAIETIRNRVDQFGVSEPLIARQGQRWIVVQLPGITNTEQAKELVGKTALLEFRMIDESEAAQKAMQKIAELGNLFEAGKISTAAAGLAPAGTLILSGKEDTFYIVSGSAALTGASLQTARVETGGDYGLPVVAFKFNPDGGRVFSALTAANVNKRLAIVLDGIVYSAPVIKGRIPGGSGIIEGNFTIEDARKLAIVLRSGALPAPVRIIEERTVGPTLGEDSIRAGFIASVIGMALVVLFMVVYYKASGFIAVMALFLNLLFLLAGLCYLRSTLTLPGIAGVILALAMGIDSNVLIFERIREELRNGKPIRIAVETGFDKAFSAIWDSHLATVISALFLFQFGTGTIKGFGVTLTLGIAISMFTAIFVTRTIFQSYLSSGNVEELSI